MKKLALALSALAVTAVSASAADMAPRYTKAPPPVPVPVWSWTGFYIGGNVGSIFEENRFTSTGFPGPCSVGNAGCVAVPNYSTLMAIGSTFNSSGNNSNRASFLGGAQIGYNWQASNYVFGIEADIQGVAGNNNGVTVITVTPSPAFPGIPVTTTATATEKLTYLGTVRGRAGWLASPSFLLYATGGLAYGEVRQTGVIVQTVGAPPGAEADSLGFGTNSSTRAGYTVGGGVEWMVAQNWSVKLEGLYYDLGRSSYLLSPNAVVAVVPGQTVGSNVARFSNRIDGGIARVGVNYHFGGPVVAKY